MKRSQRSGAIKSGALNENKNKKNCVAGGSCPKDRRRLLHPACASAVIILKVPHADIYYYKVRAGTEKKSTLASVICLSRNTQRYGMGGGGSVEKRHGEASLVSSPLVLSMLLHSGYKLKVLGCFDIYYIYRVMLLPR